MKTYEELRDRFSRFVYHGFEIRQEPGKLFFCYDFEIPGLSSFAPAWEMPCGREDVCGDKKLLNMVFSLGMVELISYWKLACPKEVVIEAGGLSEEQLAFWKSLYFNGLGEFYYTNGITENENDFMTIRAEGESIVLESAEADEGGACLVPIGGGKDSSVSLELLGAKKESAFCYIINERGATTESAAAAGFAPERVISVKRTLDPNMLRLNREGYLNGHTPFSAIVAFSATIAAYLHNLTYIVLSNESSANESTVKGSYVNHQYSKSFQFERDFHAYEKHYLKSGTYYFSLLRPLSEFQIAAYFAGLSRYHGVFKSCNAGSKENIWCGHCPKCLFVWLILSPFLSQRRLTEIFGVDMAEDPGMQTYFEQLIGLAKEKPFECVGSIDEVNAAVTLAIRDFPKERELPYLFREYKKTGLYEKTLPHCEDYFGYYDKAHLIPPGFEAHMLAELKEKGVYRI